MTTEQDIFACGEAGTSTKRGIFLPGYSVILHKAKIEEKDSYRRGLAIFYLEKYNQIISQAKVNVTFDIF